MEIILYDKPRTDIVRNCEEALRFGDLRDYFQIGGNFSIVLREGWSSEEYEWRRDIPEKREKMFVYGIGIEDNPKEVDCFKDLDIALARRMVIVLSETPRRDIDVNDWKKISEFYGLEVYAQDKNDTITVEYTGSDVPLTLHMCVLDGTVEEEISGEVKYIIGTFNAWYEDMKESLIGMYQCGKYKALPNWE